VPNFSLQEFDRVREQQIRARFEAQAEWAQAYTYNLAPPQDSAGFGGLGFTSSAQLADYYVSQSGVLRPIAEIPIPEEKEIALPMEPDMPSSKLANSFLVGCDPEMVLVKDGAIVNVSRAMTPGGEVGWDHGGYVVELRPKPAKSTFTLTKRIHTLLKEHPKLTKYESEKWKSGAVFSGTGDRARVTMGGHVHLDIPPVRPGMDAVRNYYDNHYVPALDRVTRYFEHLDLLPKNESAQRREWGDYGQFADIRGDHNRLEYRTMASWLYDPKTTLLCLTGAKLAGVDPELCLDTLRLKNISFDNLQEWFGFFKEKDADALRVCQEILPKGHKKLQADPDKDVKGSWK
jgi:hypothetical protein